MMQCPQCGESNRLGAIFCRSCGTKLEIDAITSDTFEKATGVVAKDKAKAKKRGRRIVLNVVRLLFLALIVAGVVLALQVPDVEKPDTDQELSNEFMDTRDDLLRAIDRDRTLTKTVSVAAVNSFLAEGLSQTKANKGAFRLLDTWVLFEKDGAVTWVIDSKLFGRLLRFQYAGTIEVTDDGVVFKPKGPFAAQLGKLPYPTFLMNYTASRVWTNVFGKDGGEQAEENTRLLEKISELKFSGDEITVTVGQ